MAVSDNFNRADNASVGANWSGLNSATAKVAGNRARGNATSYDYQWIVWTANTWNATQTSECEVGNSVNPSNAFDEGPIVRAAAGPDGYYAMLHSSSLRRIYRRDDGAFTVLQNMDGTVASGDTIKLEITGSTLKYFRNGAQVGSDQVDSTYSSGSAGFCVSSATGTGYEDYIDNWVGTGEVVAGKARPLFRSSVRFFRRSF
jgi:hypothetical protein